MHLQKSMPEPFGSGNKDKRTPVKTITFYQNGTTITCVFVSESCHKGVGVARCSPKDTFDIYKGVTIAELRARENFYKNLCNSFIDGFMED